MDVVLTRAFQTDEVSMGMLQIMGASHQPFFTLENPLRPTPVDSCIPEGEYLCVPYSSARFPNVYEVTGVPGRTHILFHAGNNEADTSGCILLGLSAGLVGQLPSVMNSKAAMNLFRILMGHSKFTLRVK